MAPNVEPELIQIVEQRVPHRMEIDLEKARFPCCIVWTPLPVLSWFVPFIGHIGICREDGVILDFAGPNFVNVDNFAFGSPTRYFQINKEQCYSICETSESEDEHKHNERGREMVTWDAALLKSLQEFQHHSYNILTCNCHSFVANSLNRSRFQAGRWTVVNLAIFILFNGQWVSKGSFVRTFLPFLIVFGLGLALGGWTFVNYLLIFNLVLVGWFLFGTYCCKKMIYV